MPYAPLLKRLVSASKPHPAHPPRPQHRGAYETTPIQVKGPLHINSRQAVLRKRPRGWSWWTKTKSVVFGSPGWIIWISWICMIMKIVCVYMYRFKGASVWHQKSRLGLSCFLFLGDVHPGSGCFDPSPKVSITCTSIFSLGDRVLRHDAAWPAICCV